MEDNKIKYLKTISVIIIILSVLIVFSNGLGSLFFLLMMEPKSINSVVTSDPISFLGAHFYQLCISGVIIGIINIVGAIGLRNLKNWGRICLIASSLVISILIMLITIVLINSALEYNTLGLIEISLIIISMILFLLPFILLIRYLFKVNLRKN